MNKRTPILMAGSLALLVAACGRQSEPVAPPEAPAADWTEVFAAEMLTGTPTAIPTVRNQAKPGDEVLLEGKIMGVPQPFVEGRAVFVLGDDATITSCDEMADDHCTTPWDACCDPKDVRHQGTATIQVVDADGQLVRQGLKGVHGLKELSSVRISGVIADTSKPEAMIVNATKIYVEP